MTWMFVVGSYLLGVIITFLICLKFKVGSDSALGVIFMWPVVVAFGIVLSPVMAVSFFYEKLEAKWKVKEENDKEINKIIEEEL